MPQGMNRVHRLVVGIAGVILLLWVWLSWGAPPPNPTASNQRNTAGGTGALGTNDTGHLNTAFGFNALQKNKDGVRNTASGAETLSSNSNGANNTAIGIGALLGNTIGHYNTASGASALQSNIDGSANTASGAFALLRNTGSSNTAFGFNALQNNTTGSNNIAIGPHAGLQLTTGSNNIAIGPHAGSNLSIRNHNIYLGHEGVAAESNTMRLGEAGSQTTTFIAGIATTPQPLGGQVMEVTVDLSSGQLGFNLSSARYKHDIHDMGERSRGVFQLRPVTFRYTQDPQGVLRYGLIAEEVAGVYPELVVRGPEGTVEGVQYHGLIPLLLNPTTPYSY
jgi:hypothetical protein